MKNCEELQEITFKPKINAKSKEILNRVTIHEIKARMENQANHSILRLNKTFKGE